MKTRLGIFGIGAIGLFVAVAQGCATEATVVDDPEDAAVEPVVDSGKKDSSTPPKDSSTPDSAKPDAAKPDATITDANADAADGSAVTPRPGELFDPTAPKAGDPCPAAVPVNTIIERRCGKCGVQKVLCIAGPTAGTKIVDPADYGACTGEKTAADACLPNERKINSCGYCGTQVQNCDTTCSYISGLCQNEVVNGCTANEVTYIEGLCGPGTTPPSSPSDVRKQTCSASCMKGAPEPCAPRPLDELVVSPIVGAVTTGEFSYFGTKQPKLTVGACATTADSGAMTSVHYARIKNTSAQALNVTIVNRTPTGASSVPNVLVAMYNGTNQPADRKTCVGEVRDFPEAFNVDIPAGGTIVVHTMLNTSTTTPKVKLEVHTNAVGAAQPLTLPAGANAVISAIVNQNPAQKASRAGGSSCPLSLTSSSQTVYDYVEVRNTGAAARTIKVGTADGLDTVIATYPSVPADDAARLACTGVNDTALSACDPGNIFDSCLSGVTVPANGSVFVYVTNYFTTDLGPTLLQVTTTN
jgi:hypothetical protein